jgi:hypothetical protein
MATTVSTDSSMSFLISLAAVAVRALREKRP